MKTMKNAYEGVAQIANAVDQATQSVGVKGAQLKSFQLRAMDRWRSYVRARPLATLGVGAAAAYLVESPAARSLNSQ